MIEDKNSPTETTTPVPAYLRTREQRTAIEQDRKKKKNQQRTTHFDAAFGRFYGRAESIEQSRNDMAAFLVEEFKGILHRFGKVGSTADKDGPMRVGECLDLTDLKLRNGDFSSPAKFMAYVRELIFTSEKEAHRSLNAHARKNSPLEIRDEEGEWKLGNFAPLSNSPLPSHKQEEIRANQDENAAKFLNTYRDADCNIEDAAAVLSVSAKTAQKRLERVKEATRIQDLQAYLVSQFWCSEKEAKVMAKAFVGRVKPLRQRAFSEYPATWAEVLTLKNIPLVRRVEADRLKSGWGTAVRCLYGLWMTQQPV